MLWDQVKDFGPSGLLAAAVIAILLGWLVTRRTLTDLLAAKDTLIRALTDERTELRKANDLKAEAMAALIKQNGELLEMSRLAVHVMDALPKAGGHSGVVEPPKENG